MHLCSWTFVQSTAADQAGPCDSSSRQSTSAHITYQAFIMAFIHFGILAYSAFSRAIAALCALLPSTTACSAGPMIGILQALHSMTVGAPSTDSSASHPGQQNLPLHTPAAAASGLFTPALQCTKSTIQAWARDCLTSGSGTVERLEQQQKRLTQPSSGDGSHWSGWAGP